MVWFDITGTKKRAVFDENCAIASISIHEVKSSNKNIILCKMFLLHSSPKNALSHAFRRLSPPSWTQHHHPSSSYTSIILLFRGIFLDIIF
jgi:hypothetical protein